MSELKPNAVVADWIIFQELWTYSPYRSMSAHPSDVGLSYVIVVNNMHCICAISRSRIGLHIIVYDMIDFDLFQFE